MKVVNSDLAYDYIRKRILSGKYAPGQPLLTEVLSAEIKVSRTPVRDALRQLEADGLVTIQARMGARVKKMDFVEFQEMCDMRLALESHAAGRAALKRTDQDLREMRLALNAMRRLTDQIVKVDDQDALHNELVREDVRFHIAIMTAARNELMKTEILRLHLLNRVASGHAGTRTQPRNELDERRRQIVASHEEIYAAIADRKPEAASQAMARHIQELIDLTLRFMVENESPTTARELTSDELVYTA